MACNENRYKNIFKLSRYKKYIRDTNFTDDELNEMIVEVFEEMSDETRIFRDMFAFTISNKEDTYNIREMYEIYQKFNNDPTIDFISEINLNSYNEDDIKNILIDPTKSHTNVTTKSDEMCYNRYKALIDLLVYDKNTRTFRSILFSWFQLITPDVYQLKIDLNDNETYDVIAIISIVPNINNVDENVEKYCRNVIINGLKYYTNSTYSSANNDPGTNLLYQRYYNSKKQLSFDFPNYVSDGLIVNPDWNY